jgi:hypothetical protein
MLFGSGQLSCCMLFACVHGLGLRIVATMIQELAAVVSWCNSCEVCWSSQDPAAGAALGQGAFFLPTKLCFIASPQYVGWLLE